MEHFLTIKYVCYYLSIYTSLLKFTKTTLENITGLCMMSFYPIWQQTSDINPRSTLKWHKN